MSETPTGTQLRDEGVARIMQTEWESAQRWKGWAMECISILADSGRTFTSEDVRVVVGDPPAGKHNLMGAVFLTASRRRLIIKTGFTKAKRPSLHASDLATWVGAT